MEMDDSNTRQVDAEIVEEESVSDGRAIEAISRSEIDSQIATARRYPRVISDVIKKATELATYDEEIAGSCYYTLKRKNKDGSSVVIEGPSVRLSEIFQGAYGNMRSAGRLISVGEKTVRVQGVAFDLEQNSMASVEVERSIWSKRYGRYTVDGIVNASNAAISIALRNARFQVIPRAYVDKVLAAAKLTSLGKAESMEKRRQKALEWWTKAGVKKEEVLSYLEVKSEDDITVEHLIALTGLRSAIRDGETTIDETFRPKAPASTTGGPTLASALSGTVTTDDDPHAKEKPSKEKLAGEAKSLFGGKK